MSDLRSQTHNFAAGPSPLPTSVLEVRPPPAFGDAARPQPHRLADAAAFSSRLARRRPSHQEAAGALLNFNGTGIGICEHSHRGKDFAAVLTEAEGASGSRPS
jgi:phosphoserine aminotransferase